MRIVSGTTDQYVYFVAVDATDFTTRETGLSSFTVYRSRNGAAAAAMTTPTINETDSTNMPGVYELLLDEDTTIAAGNDTEEIVFHITATGMAPVTRVIELYRPETTAGNTLDVTSTGAAGIDWGNVENASTTVDLSATSINLCDTVTTNTDLVTAASIADAVWDEAQADHTTAGNFGEIATEIASILTDTAEIGTAGAGLTNVPWNASWDAEVESECNDALVALGLDHMVSASVTGTDITDNSIIARLVSNGTPADWDDFDNTSHSLQALSVDVVANATTLGTPSNLGGGGTLSDNLSDMAGATFATGTDSLEAIRDRGDAAWTTGAGGSDRLLMVDTTIATLASQTSFTLTAGSADDDAYNGCTIVIEDVSTSTQKAIGIIDDYTGSTKTVTLLEDPAVFTMAATDKVYILAEKGLKPTTAANYHLDISADGTAGIDWANVTGQATAVDLSATDIQLCDTVTTNTDMRGTDSALLASSAPTNFSDLAITVTTGQVTVGTNNDKSGYSISGTKTTLDALNDVSTAEVNTEVDTALTDIGLDHLVSASVAGTDVTDNSIIARMVSSAATADWDTFVNTDDSLQAISESGGGGPTAAQIADAVWDEAQADHTTAGTFGETATEIADILTDTADMQPKLGTVTDLGGGATVGANLSDMAGGTFATGTDSLEAIRDRGDAAWTTGAGGSDRLLMVDTTIATLASQTSFTLTAGSADDDAYNGCTIVIEDAATSTQKAIGIVDDYTGSTKTVTLLEDPGVFTMATTDKVYILAEKGIKPTTAANYHLDIDATGNAGIDWGNISNATTAVDLSGTDIQLCDTVTTNTDMRGTDSAFLAASAPTNFSDLAITVTTGQVTVGTNNDKTGYSISGTKTTLDALNDVSTAEVNTEADTALTDFWTSPATLVDLVWDEVLSKASHDVANSAGKRLRLIDAAFEVHSGTAQGGTATTITLDAGASATDDIYRGDRVVIIDGTGAQEHGLITSYNGTTKVATMSESWVVTPDNTSEFEIIPADADVETWAHAAVSTSSTTSKPEVDVASVSDDSTAANNLELAFDGTGYGFTGCTMPTVTTLTGHTAQTGDSFARLGAPAGASVSADIAAAQTDLDTITDTGVTCVALTSAAFTDIWATDTLTEAYAADGAAATPAQAVYLIMQHLGESSITGTTKTVKQLDGTTTAATFTLDDGTTPTSITRAT